MLCCFCVYEINNNTKLHIILCCLFSIPFSLFLLQPLAPISTHRAIHTHIDQWYTDPPIQTHHPTHTNKNKNKNRNRNRNPKQKQKQNTIPSSHTPIHLSRTFSYFLSSSHQTKTEHNPRVSNPKKKKNPPPKPSRQSKPIQAHRSPQPIQTHRSPHPSPPTHCHHTHWSSSESLSEPSELWFKPIGALTPSHRSHPIPPLSKPTGAWVWREQRADERKRRKREKRGEIMREKREIPG